MNNKGIGKQPKMGGWRMGLKGALPSTEGAPGDPAGIAWTLGREEAGDISSLVSIINIDVSSVSFGSHSK